MTELLTTSFSFLCQNFWHYSASWMNMLAFDIGTNVMVSMFGYSLNAGFAKNKKTNHFSFGRAATGIPKSTGRGAVIINFFNKVVNFLIENSFSIIWACGIALLVIIIVRYLLTHLFYSASSNTRRAKTKKRK